MTGEAATPFPRTARRRRAIPYGRIAAGLGIAAAAGGALAGSGGSDAPSIVWGVITPVECVRGGGGAAMGDACLKGVIANVGDRLACALAVDRLP